MSAAENNQLESCKWLIRHGANVNAAMATGWTAMHAAAKNGHAKVVEALLQAGGNKKSEASHRDFGKGQQVADVTTNTEVLKVLSKY